VSLLLVSGMLGTGRRKRGGGGTDSCYPRQVGDEKDREKRKDHRELKRSKTLKGGGRGKKKRGITLILFI